jgi:hypothetical protein
MNKSQAKVMMIVVNVRGVIMRVKQLFRGTTSRSWSSSENETEKARIVEELMDSAWRQCASSQCTHHDTVSSQYVHSSACPPPPPQYTWFSPITYVSSPKWKVHWKDLIFCPSVKWNKKIADLVIRISALIALNNGRFKCSGV